MKHQNRAKIALLLTLSMAAVTPITRATPPASAQPANLSGARGEFNASLAFLARFHTAPAMPGQSNHFFDLWEGQTFRSLVHSSGLTNNRTLFINSHGMGLDLPQSKRYAFFPHQALLAPDQATPYFSARDLATVMGPHHTARIHNIVVGGCNEDGSFSARELRAWFPNATNITHMAPGQLGCQPMLLQAVMTESTNVQPIYDSPFDHAGPTVRWLPTTKPKRRAASFAPYIAELFLPFAAKPYKQQIAGRELLDPTRAPLPNLDSFLAESSEPR